MYRGTVIQIMADLSSEKIESRREWNSVKPEFCIWYLAKLCLKNEGWVKKLPGKQKLSEFVAQTPAVQAMLGQVL